MKNVKIVEKPDGSREAFRVKPEDMNQFIAEQERRGTKIAEGGRKTARNSGIGKIKSYREELKRRDNLQRGRR